MIYTTNAVEALHRSLRKIIKTRGSFPNDGDALKLLCLAVKNAGMRWRRAVEWTAAMGQFAIHFGSTFSRINAMSPTAQRNANRIATSMAIDRQTRWAEYGHREFDGGLRSMPLPTTLPPSRKPLTQNT